jgi:oligopeptide transport system substrate-binding protein
MDQEAHEMAATQAGFHLRVVNPYPDPINYDPNHFIGTPSIIVIRQLFSGLVAYNPQMDVTPDVAAGWDMEDGGKTYRFHLRKDVFWSDGVPVSANDFLFSWRRANEQKNGFELGDRQIQVEVPDPVTLVVRLDKPADHFLHLLSQPALYPIPRHAVEKHGDRWLELDNLVTNGPFQLESWEPTQAIVFVRNPRYHGDYSGNVERVTYYSRSNWTEKLAMYERSEVEVLGLPSIPKPEILQARSDYADEYRALATFTTEILLFNQRYAPFADRRVRQALAMTINQIELAETNRQGLLPPAQGGLIPPGMPGHAGQVALPYDPARARELLAAAGFPGGQGFPPLHLSVIDAYASSGFYCQSQWREHLGIEIAVDSLGWPDFMKQVFDRPEQVACYTVGFPPMYYDPYCMLFESQILDHSSYSNDRFDQLQQTARNATSQEERYRTYQAMDTLLADEAVFVPLLYHRTNLLVKPWVKSYPYLPLWSWLWKDAVMGEVD